MALVPNTWYLLTFDAIANPPWSTPNYSIPGEIVDAIINTTVVPCFCINDNGTNSTIKTRNNADIILPTAALNISSTPTMNTTVMDDGETWYSIRLSDGTWLYYGDQSGLVKALAVPNALGVFIT